MDKVLVLGSNSFSGSDFIDRLLETGRYEVVGASRSPEKKQLFLPYLQSRRSPFQFQQIDLNRDLDRLQKLLDDWKPRYVVNFAAQSEVAPSWKAPGDWFQTNTVSLTNLANILKNRDHLERYVHISSPEVYGSCVGVVKEDSPVNPSTPYAASKAAGDMSLFTFQKNFDFPLVMIRATNVYGAHQQLFKIIPRSAIYLKMGKKIQLHGGGKAIKSFIHVRDVSNGELAVMEKGETGEIYHLSPDQGVTVREVVQKICELGGHDFHSCTEDVEERLGQDAAYVIDSTKAREQFDWSPKIDLDEGLAGVQNWVSQYWETIQGEPMEYCHKR